MEMVEDRWREFAKKWRRRQLFIAVTIIAAMIAIFLGMIYIAFYTSPTTRLMISTYATWIMLFLLVGAACYFAAELKYIRIIVVDRIFGGIEHVSWFVPAKPEEVSVRDLPELFASDFPETKVTIIKCGRFGKILVFPFSSAHGVPPAYFFNEGRFIFKCYGRKASREEFVAYLFGLPYNPDNPEPQTYAEIRKYASRINPYVLMKHFGLPEKYMLILPYSLTPFMAAALHESELAEAPGKLTLIQRITGFYGAIINRLMYYIQKLAGIEKARIEDLAYSTVSVVDSATKSATVPIRIWGDLMGVEPEKVREAGIAELVRTGSGRALIGAGALSKQYAEELSRELGYVLTTPDQLKSLQEKAARLDMIEEALKTLGPPPTKKIIKKKEEKIEEAG